MRIQKILDSVCKEICERYCKWPEQSKDVEELIEEHCNGCPLVNKL